jgi:uncharacterized protein
VADHASTVMGIYEAFGRGDLPAILDCLDDDVEWERGATSSGVPWLEPGRGKDHVMAFFAAVQEHLDFTRFEPTGVAVGDGVVVAFLEVEAVVTETGDTIEEHPELHTWWFDDDGKVSAFRHHVDTARHKAAFGI